MRTIKLSNILINTSWASINGFRELIADVYYRNENDEYEFIRHHQHPVKRRGVYERKLIRNELKSLCKNID